VVVPVFYRESAQKENVMFEKLVVSSAQKRSGRTAKFFVGTSLIYLSLACVAFALSVLLAEPKLADSSYRDGIQIAPSPRGGTPPRVVVTQQRTTESTPRPDPNNVMKYDEIAGQQKIGPPQFKIPDGVTIGPNEGPPNGDPNDASNTIGTSLVPIDGNRKATDSLPIPPDPPKPQPRPADKTKPLALSSTVLQGKAINRVVPIYPEIPRKIRLYGDVSTEVIISPDGRVESVRVVSGHPLLIQAAMDAARRWRFEPTILNGVPVRVTGIITFVFKLND